ALNSNLSSGSGDSDIRVLVPNTSFDNSPFVYLYSHFGAESPDWVSESGFEEWGVRTPQANVAHISGIKFGDTNDNGVKDPGESGLGGGALFIDFKHEGGLESRGPSTLKAAAGAHPFSVRGGAPPQPTT